MGDLDRRGAVLPLAHDAKNTKEQSWNELTFDYYPDKEACDADFLYEDDGETTAYRQGEFRIGEYEAKYDRKENAYVIRFAASEGSFAGKRACTMRKAAVRVHSCGGKIERAEMNGEELVVEQIGRDAEAFPFAAEGGAADGDVFTVRVCMDLSQSHEIKFYLA